MAAIRALLIAAAITLLVDAQQTVTLRTGDGGLVYGDLYGQSDRAVLLAHGGPFNKESWREQALALKAAGFRVLAIDFRGYGPSRAGSERSEDTGRKLDVLAAIHYLRQNGAKEVSVVGASMGGDYAIDAAEGEPEAIDRLVLLASGEYVPLTRMQGPKLFIVARNDSNGAGLRLPRIRAQYEKALEPKELIVLDGSAHAQYLFQTEQGERVMREILRFLSTP